jgi:hypothetical protein
LRTATRKEKVELLNEPTKSETSTKGHQAKKKKAWKNLGTSARPRFKQKDLRWRKGEITPGTLPAKKQKRQNP